MLRTPASLSAVLSGTWAARPTPIPANGKLYFAIDVGANGTLLQSNGTRWRPFNGAPATLKALGASVSGITNSEQLVLQTLIPAGVIQTLDSLRFWLSLTKSGTTDGLTLTLRIGLAGTTADPAVVNTALAMAASTITFGGIFDLKMLTSTSAQRQGTGAASGTHTYLGGTGTAQSGSIAIPDISANALYASVGIASGGATNTVGITSGAIQLVTP